MWRSRWDAGVLKAEALALLPCGLGMAFSQSHVMAARRHQHGRLIIEVDEYSSNPTQAFTFYNINQGRFQPPHVQMVDPVPHDAPKPPGYTRFVCVSDTHSRTDPIQMPYGDVLIHAGDFTELGLPSEVKKFNEWLGSLPYEYKVVIAGNHELTFDQEFMADLIKQDFYYFPSVSKLKPENYENVQSLLTNCIYLQDAEVTVRGFRIYGSPCPGFTAGALTSHEAKPCWRSGTSFLMVLTSWSPMDRRWASWTGSPRRCSGWAAWSCSTRCRGASSRGCTSSVTSTKGTVSWRMGRPPT
ncbi:metallophosphoesterase domain-containing protein 1 isoform X2 [Sciurus carolinensis]|uniref:metallophosphoesterase domain-containing protein 1 isoform X2 n=1 Tax=Sciurus carolinensis TaxID=30640 RepID=UPI001FB3B5FF|nr:metallophosphoesterase domain-containing protein 1 isoform X2 [Sciurus carolinensis]